MWPFSGRKLQGTGRRRRPAGESKPEPVKRRDPWEEWDTVRPDWHAVRKFNDLLDVERPLEGQPLSGRGGTFYRATVGELADPGGTDERVDVVLWLLKQNSSTRGGHELWSSGVMLTFPRTLPFFGFYPQSNYWKPTPTDFRPTPRKVLKHLLREYDALAALGPEHGATRVLVADDRVFSALVRPEVVGRPQLSGRHLRLNGSIAVAWSRGHTAPKMLEELAIELYELVNLLPRT